MIDATDINAYSNEPLWDGITFGAEVGIWFHPTAYTTFRYDPTTSGITSFYPGIVGYYDSGAFSTVVTVPEPTSIALLSIGAIACFGFHRRKSKHRVTL